MGLDRRNFLAGAAGAGLALSLGGAAAAQVDGLAKITGGAAPISPQERLARMAKAQRLMKAQGREDFLIIFAGDDQGRTGYREEVEGAIAAAGLSGDVSLVGHCDDMPAAYQICDIAMLPTTKPESFGRTAVEPQVMGKPVLASDHGGTTETVLHGETGWLVKVDDAEAWASAMTKAIEMGPARLAAMGQAAAALAP